MNPSEIPVGTTINVAGEGDFKKREDGVWESTTTKDLTVSNDHLVSAHWTIESVPFGVIWQMAIELSAAYGDKDDAGEPIYFMNLINDAMAEHNRVEAREAEEN